MIERYGRPFFQKWCVDPLALHLRNPLLITACACLLGIASAVALVFSSPYLAFALLLTSGYCDILDGTVARLRKQTTPCGTTLDIVSDRLVEFAILFALYLVHRDGVLSMLMVGACLMCITTFLTVGIFVRGEGHKSFYYSPGLIERAEAFLFFGAMILVPQLFFPLGVLFTVLVALTAALRLIQFMWSAAGICRKS